MRAVELVLCLERDHFVKVARFADCILCESNSPHVRCKVAERHKCDVSHPCRCFAAIHESVQAWSCPIVAALAANASDAARIVFCSCFIVLSTLNEVD